EEDVRLKRRGIDLAGMYGPQAESLLPLLRECLEEPVAVARFRAALAIYQISGDPEPFRTELQRELEAPDRRLDVSIGWMIEDLGSDARPFTAEYLQYLEQDFRHYGTGFGLYQPDSHHLWTT